MSKGLVLYTDGGSHNPGHSGWGVHGYLYDTDITKKISGNVGHSLTKDGYVLKLGDDDKTSIDEVMPMLYMDWYGTIAHSTTNNVAELSAVINCFKRAVEYDINNIHILTDSEYVRKGLEFWVKTWKQNNWLKQDGSEPANISFWKELVEAKEVLLERGVKINISWVKGHSDILGNVLADKLATIAVMASVRNKSIADFTDTPPIGYWKTETGDHNPLIANSRMFFNTMPEYIKRGEYYLSDTNKEDDSYGARTSDGAYSVVILEEPDHVLELIRNYQSKVAYGVDTIIMARLDAIYRGSIYTDIIKYGDIAFNKVSNDRLDLYALTKNNDGYNYKEPITYEYNPPKLCMRAVENLSRIAILLNQYIDGNPNLITTDITDILYETIEKTNKKGKTETIIKLKSIYNVGYAALKTNMNYKTDNGTASISFTLTLGIYILNRNSLKRLEGSNPKVTIITWLDSPDVVRYATITEAGNDKGIYCGVYSNRRIIN